LIYFAILSHSNAGVCATDIGNKGKRDAHFSPQISS
jgi:hypothetical protein